MANESSTIVQRLWSYCNVLCDESLEEFANLPDPDVLAQEIMADLQAALEQFSSIYEALGEE